MRWLTGTCVHTRALSEGRPVESRRALAPLKLSRELNESDRQIAQAGFHSACQAGRGVSPRAAGLRGETQPTSRHQARSHCRNSWGYIFDVLNLSVLEYALVRTSLT